MTQRDLAALVGVTYQYVSEIELGEYNPRIENVVKIIKALGLTREEAIDLWIEVGVPAELFDVY